MRTTTALFSLLAWLLAIGLSLAGDWSRFRGPNGSGVAPDSGYPSELSEQNLAWKVAVRPGKSSPIVTEQHVFLTANDEAKLFTQCLDRRTGDLLWERQLDRGRAELMHDLNGPSSSTPVSDGENVYVFFRDYGLVSYDPSGKVRWRTPLGPFTAVNGASASPIIAGGSLILVVDQSEGSFIAAYQLRDGETRWRVNRPETSAWASPVLYEDHRGQMQIIAAGPGQFSAHALQDGHRVWTQTGLPPLLVASPVLEGRTVFAFGYGAPSAPLFSEWANDYDKNGDGKMTAAEYEGDSWLTHVGKYEGDRDGVVTQADWDAANAKLVAPSGLVAVRLEAEAGGEGSGIRPREVWRYVKSFVGTVPSPVLYEGMIYIIKNGGIFTAVESASGKEIKVGRLREALGAYYASPVAADGKIFLVSEEGKATVVKAGADWEILSTNDTEEGCFGTPALSDGQVFLRTGESLYCFGGRK
jgi:outer membrane protein assembly factor BamB